MYGLCVIIKIVVLLCRLILVKYFNNFVVDFEFSELVGLFVKIILGFVIKVWVVVICCFCFIDIFGG